MGCQLAKSVQINEYDDAQREYDEYGSEDDDGGWLVSDKHVAIHHRMVNKEMTAEGASAQDQHLYLELERKELTPYNYDKFLIMRWDFTSGKSFEFDNFKDLALKILRLAKDVEIKRFKDPLFQPKANSLFDPRFTKAYDERDSNKLTMKHRAKREHRINKWSNVIWKRPSEWYGEKNFQLFKKIDANDISQGTLGDCYILACISAIANSDPMRIKRMFVGFTSKEEDPTGFSLQLEEQQLFKDIGMIAVYLHLSGELKQVLIDDNFPFDDTPEHDSWAFARMSKDDEYWVLCLEKAIAKAFGSYEMIEGGKPYQAFSWLTGFPSHCIFHEGLPPVEIWQHILKGVADGLPMVSTINSDYLSKMSGDPDYLKTKGLADHHAYALLEAVDLVEAGGDQNEDAMGDQGGNHLRLVKLRNPYGTRSKKEWEGRWSESSKEMTDYYAEKLKVTKALDGVFWMKLEDYLQNFTLTTINLYQDNYTKITITDRHNIDKHAVTAISVKQDINTNVIFSLYQIHRRLRNSLDYLQGQHNYATVQIYLARIMTPVGENKNNKEQQKQESDQEGEINSDEEEQAKKPKIEIVHGGDHTIQLADGARDTGTACTYFVMDRLKKGEYVLFYRTAFPFEEGLSTKERHERAAKMERKFNVVINLPQSTRDFVSWERVNTDYYDKETFLQLRRQFKENYE